jgi:hypothetical protein
MPIDLQALARYGAQARLTQLQQEIDDLRRAFPDLGADDNVGRTSRNSHAEGAPPDKTRLGKRKPMTAAQKRAVGERMRAYWASRRRRTANDTSTAETAKQAQPGATTTKRVMSADARDRMASAQRKRRRKVKRAGKKA